jgi:hypothetical protein
MDEEICDPEVDTGNDEPAGHDRQVKCFNEFFCKKAKKNHLFSNNRIPI